MYLDKQLVRLDLFASWFDRRSAKCYTSSSLAPARSSCERRLRKCEVRLCLHATSGICLVSDLPEISWHSNQRLRVVSATCRPHLDHGRLFHLQRCRARVQAAVRYTTSTRVGVWRQCVAIVSWSCLGKHTPLTERCVSSRASPIAR